MRIVNRLEKYKILLNKLTDINNGLYIVCYHEIASIITVENLAIKKITTDFELFKEHIDFFKNNFEMIDYKKAYSLIESGAEKTGKYLLLTFDDNYKGVLDNAIPYLNKFNISPIVFCNNSTFFHNKLLWRVWLGEVYKEIYEYFPGYNFNKIMRITKINPTFIKEKLWDKYLEYETKEQYFFTYEDYKNSALKFLVSPHTKNHFMLSKLNELELQEELINSIFEFKENIEDEFSSKFFAYPYGHKGSFSNNEINLLSDNFKEIIAFNDYNISNGTKSKLNYPRINIIDESVEEVKLKLKKFKF